MALEDIDHIVFVMLENRSFDHMLGYLSRGPNGRLDIDGIRDDEKWQREHANYDSAGNEYRSEKLDRGERVQDPPHGPDWVSMQINTPKEVQFGPREMGGFVHSYFESRRKKGKKPPVHPGAVMGYYDAGDVWAFDFFARHYCVCKRWFTPLPAGTQPNRLMAMAGEAHYAKNKTLIPRHELVYDWCRDNHVDWRVYIWGAVLPFFALMPEWWDEILGLKKGPRLFTHFNRLRDDWNGPAPVPKILFIEPEYSELRGKHANDDHAPTRITGAQSFVADIYNILIGNKERWARTLLIITYDEHGGFFDHVPPLKIKGTAGKRSWDTTGPRVPAFLISQHVGPGTVFPGEVDHTAFLSLLAEKHTPKYHYSKNVFDRQQPYAAFARLSSALLPTARTEAPPPLPSPWRVNAMKLAIPFGFGPADSPPDADTPTAAAFFEAAHRTAAQHPGVAADLTGLPGYVNTTTAPEVKQESHIGDE
ncbi:MAG: phospholipase [Sphingomonadales bacterium]|jgi:phospholipase C|nr:phospholipase [Sphingomonadales bacterium]